MKGQLAAAVLQASETAVEAAVALLWSPLAAARETAVVILLSLNSGQFTQRGNNRSSGASQVR
jgi:hypothetical protein